MDYRHNTTGSIETQQEVIKKHPNVSFPYPVTNDVIESLGYSCIFEGLRPSITPPYEVVEQDGWEEIDSKWYTKFTKRTLTGDEKTDVDSNAATRERSVRDFELEKTDYLALSDVTMSDDWKTYRQALRDLPTASGWPHTHTWPTKPS